MGRIELPTSPLPRECSTTEPHGPNSRTTVTRNFAATFETVAGAGDGNRTRVISLEGWGSTIELLPHLANRPDADPQSAQHQFRWWRRLDSNQRRRKPTDLQSAPFSHSGTPPASHRLCHEFFWGRKPVNGFFASGLQPTGDRAEMPAPDEGNRRSPRRHRRGMVGFQDQMPVVGQPPGFGLGVRAPEQKRLGATRLGTLPDHLVSEGLPSQPGMTRRSPLFDGEGGVQQQHPLIRPAQQAA